MRATRASFSQVGSSAARSSSRSWETNRLPADGKTVRPTGCDAMPAALPRNLVGYSTAFGEPILEPRFCSAKPQRPCQTPGHKYSHGLGSPVRQASSRTGHPENDLRFAGSAPGILELRLAVFHPLSPSPFYSPPSPSPIIYFFNILFLFHPPSSP